MIRVICYPVSGRYRTEEIRLRFDNAEKAHRHTQTCPHGHALSRGYIETK